MVTRAVNMLTVGVVIVVGCVVLLFCVAKL